MILFVGGEGLLHWIFQPPHAAAAPLTPTAADAADVARPRAGL